MNIKLRNCLVATGLFFISQSTVADVRFMLETGLHVGGDDLVSVTFTDGSTEDINAGELLSFGAGVSVDLTDSLELRFVHSYKLDTITATNGDIDFTRWTSNLTLMYRSGPWRFGGGLGYHSSIDLDGSGVASVVDARFDNATGLVLEFNYFWWEHMYLGGQYTNIDYKHSASGIKYDASSMGLVFGYQF